MTEHRTLNTVIHAAFRRDLGRFDEALADLPKSPGRADELTTAWDHFSYQLQHRRGDLLLAGI